MPNLYLSKTIEFLDGSKEDIEFEVSFLKSGFNYCYGNQKGFKQELEIDNIDWDGSDLTAEQNNFIEKMLDNGELDEFFYEAYQNQDV